MRLIAALAAAGGEVEICGCDPAVYGAFLRFLAETGVTVTRAGDCVRLARDPAAPLRGGARLTADAWPAFATDTAPLAAPPPPGPADLLLAELSKLPLDSLTPLDALTLLSRWKAAR